MSISQTVFIAGAAGGLGSTISNRLFAAGYKVICLVRPEDSCSRLKTPADQIFRGYIEDADIVSRLLDGVHVAINCAALLPNARDRGHEAFQKVNVDGALNLLEQCNKKSVGTAIFFSTISVVDHINRTITPERLDDFNPDPADPYQSSKVAMELALKRASPTYSGTIIVLRPAFVYGPGNYSVWAEALDLLTRSKMVLLDGGKALFPLIYSEDIARFILHLLNISFESRSYHRFILASPDRTVMRDVFDFLADELGVQRPKTFPSYIAKILAVLTAAIPAKMRSGRVKLLTRARVDQYSKGYNLSAALQPPPPLGFVCDTDFRLGFKAMLEDYRNSSTTI